MTARRPNDIGDLQFTSNNDTILASTFTPGLLTGSSLSGNRFSKLDEYRGVSQHGQEKTYQDGPWIEDYSDSNRMDANSTDGESEADEDLDGETLLNKAKESLEELRLNEAEQQFLRATTLLQEKAEDNTRALVEAYLGLAEVCTRKSRAFRQSPLEWFWLCVHASSLLSEVVDMCNIELHDETDNQSIEWYTTQCKFADSRSQNLLDVLGRTLFNWFKEDWRLVDPNHFSNLLHSRTPLTPRSRYPLTGSSLVASGLRPYQSGFMNHAFSIESLHEPLLKGYGHAPSGNVNWFKRIQNYCHLRLENKNVKEIINEITTFKEIEDSSQSPSDPKIDKISTISEETDLDLAKEVLAIKKGEDEEEEVFTEETYDLEAINEKSRTDSIVKEYSLMYELASSDVDTSGWEFFLEKRKDYIVQTVLEICSEYSTDEALLSHQDKETEEDESSQTETTIIIEPVEVQKKKKKKEKEKFSPLKENCLKLTIAKALQLVAHKLIQAESYSEAENLCEEILQIVEEIQDGTVKLLRFSALLLQSTGLLCFRQGNRFNGMRNLEKALKIYRDLQDVEHHREVALVLIDLGNAYADDLHDEALYDKVIAAICEFFERDASDEEHTGNSTPERTTEETPEEIDLKKRITEAVSCYSEALRVLENNETSQKHVVAMAMRKLGDCHFVQRQYTEALDWYEKSLKLHRTSGFHGKESVLENAHVLTMLGVSTFMLHVYPRASHVFELALHMVKHAHGLNMYTFLHSLVLSLLGITYYKMKAYHKCVSMCSRAFETFWNLYDEKVAELPQQRFWLVCQDLYILGNTYNVLNMHHKAIKFLEIGRAFMKESLVGEKRQHMRILQILGDCYFAQYDYKTALTYYNEALDIGDKVSSSTESEAFERMESSQSSNMTTSTENLDMALHNQLLSRSADAHISMKQYQNAVHYLEQARDIQDVLEDDIKGDLVSTLHQLGQMHSMAGDVDKAIESYKESLEVFREIHNGELAPEMCITLGNLATMCYVKACICEDIDSELEMILSAEQYFQAALKEELNPSVCVKYANFLYSQANYEDAVMYLEDSIKSRKDNEEENMDRTLFFPRPWSCDIVYGGLERVTLPEPLQEEVDAQEEAIMPTSVLAYYILVLSYKMLGKLRHAEDALISLMGEVYARDIPFLYSVLGYAFMELGLFSEAAEEFHMAWYLDNEYNLALDNYCLCLAAYTYNILERAFATIFVHCKIWNEDQKIAQKVASLQGYYN
ncbi:tetratricopeptide repeat protein 28 [Biomphalaria glabrata]|uniref:Uncharacterized protein LOC106072626 isoform X2 n=1 Tax=Biomphalaria glabrata TaxID=6526 RepID=A0A9U8EI20_BIOGL|nr:uncharacterized protein LOC106072626 isoform X2 [Biomphalaria glabrata]KAI8769038.1 Tetratricopeptide repeat protein 28 [Biomphalaria glabrata]